ncbi:hypothetical protein [Photobacterium kasasachensis]|uniref:hypothetical protein n=1 Tax=Photobacterium kasasachensis TaxID=2910240 RepID=UPI003D0F2D5A
MKKSELPQRAKETLKYLLDSDGEVIYSSHETLKKGDIYLMGLNPGGSGFISINDHIDKMLTRDENSYIDEAWQNGQKSYSAGDAPLQKRIRWLIENLGYDTRDVCATNLIFKTTKSADELCFGLAGICWGFHEYILDIVKPKLILTFGNSETSASPYFFLKSLFSGEETRIKAGHGDWVCKGFKTQISGRDTFIVGLPHLSYYSPVDKSYVIDWISENANITRQSR